MLIYAMDNKYTAYCIHPVRMLDRLLRLTACTRKIVSPLVFAYLPTFFGTTKYRCNCCSCKFSGLLPVKNENM